MRLFVILSLQTAIGTAVVAALVWTGVYNIGADTPHWPATSWIVATLRERSIGARAAGVAVPPLNDPIRIAEGARHYSAMCSGCHLAPGVEDSGIRAGLYPRPPDLARHVHGRDRGYAVPSAARQFWIIKHGIKLTAMPAWGTTHSDDAIWGLVAFLQVLPEMTPAYYARLKGGDSGTAAVRGHDQRQPHGTIDGSDTDGPGGSHPREHTDARTPTWYGGGAIPPLLTSPEIRRQ